MRKQDQLAPIFSPGPRLDAPDVRPWLDAQRARGALLELPVTVWRRPALRATLAAEPLALTDAPLGIALADQLRARFGERDPCFVRLVGRFGGAPRTGPETFAVYALAGPVEPDEAPRARRACAPADLALRSLRPAHCARGPARCARCAERARAPARPALLDLAPYGDAARPVLERVRDGARTWHAYAVLRTFDDDATARAFAAAHGVTDVELEP